MSKKFLCVGLSVLLLTTGCTRDNSTLSNRLISLKEIRTEAENMLELDQKYENLSLSETKINIPTTEQIKNFSLFPVPLSPEERETFLLDTVRWFGGEERDINNIIYLPYDGDDLSYSQVRDDPDRGSNYFVCYKDDDLNLGINIPGQYIYGIRNETAKIAGKEGTWFIDNQEHAKGEYDIRKEIPDTDISLRDGVQSLAEIVENMICVLSEKPFFQIDGLSLCPSKAAIYPVGENEGVNVRFCYEYEGVEIDYHTYGRNMETDKYEGIRAHLTFDASTVWKNGIDEFYGAHLYFLKTAEETHYKFIGLDDFLGMLSEKLTGNTEFVVESVELIYGLRNVYPDERDTASDEEKFNIPPSELKAYPMWVAYLPRTSFNSAPKALLTVDAITGEMNIYNTF